MNHNPKHNPLINSAGERMLLKLREHPDAPLWTQSAGDRLYEDDLAALNIFRQELKNHRSSRQDGVVPPHILKRILSLKPKVQSIKRRLHEISNLSEQWQSIETMSRENIAVSVWELVPNDADLKRLIVYRTAGTTGHALLVPHDPRAAACYQPLIELALALYGIDIEFSAERVACFLVGAQARTVTYPTVLAAWNMAGFAKLNLRKSEWPDPESSRRYFKEMSPQILTGDPISFAEMLKLEIEAEPAAMISTAVAMSPSLKRKLAAAYNCPVIDWYSLTETGPLGYYCRTGDAYHLLPHDVHIEVLREDGSLADAGERGEITVTGGRNPFLPLLRYRTGDFGALDYSPCSCGDPMPRIVNLEGRAPVLFKSTAGSIVNPVDLSRVLREFPLLQHELNQRDDLSCLLIARPLPGEYFDEAAIKRELRKLLGEVSIEIQIDHKLGDRQEGKIIPYRSDFLLED